MQILRLLLLTIVLSTTSCVVDEIYNIEEANYSIDLNLANETDWQMADDVLAVINTHRTTLSLLPIQRDQQYASAYAVEHTLYMIEKAEINHHNFGVRNEGLRSKGAVQVAENVAYGYNTAKDVVEAWLSSESHKQTIEGNYTHTGFGIVKGKHGGYYYTQLFYR
tara:strand:+ start:629 stop:1123 length:495 start_codon:yes stop_codon:yes gene_type:complete